MCNVCVNIFGGVGEMGTCSSAYYMAPEIVLKQGHGKAVDWWSLGVLIYEMLCGLPPFYHDNPRVAYERLLTLDLEFPVPAAAGTPSGGGGGGGAGGGGALAVSAAARGLLRGLLRADPRARIGGDVAAAEERSHDGVTLIKRHEWFVGIDFDRVLAKQVGDRGFTHTRT